MARKSVSGPVRIQRGVFLDREKKLPTQKNLSEEKKHNSIYIFPLFYVKIDKK